MEVMAEVAALEAAQAATWAAERVEAAVAGAWEEGMEEEWVGVEARVVERARVVVMGTRGTE